MIRYVGPASKSGDHDRWISPVRLGKNARVVLNSPAERPSERLLGALRVVLGVLCGIGRAS